MKSAHAFGSTSRKNREELPSKRTTTDQMNGQLTYRQEGRTANIVLAIGGLTCFVSTPVLKIPPIANTRHTQHSYYDKDTA